MGGSTWNDHALAPHRRSAVEAGLERVKRDVGPAPGVHELLPARIEEALVVLRDVALGDEPWIIRMRPRVTRAHRQILGVPAPEAARARGGYLTPAIDGVLLEHARRTIMGLAPDTDHALQVLGHIPVEQHEVPKLGLERAAGQGEAKPEDPVREDRMVTELHLARAECAEPALDLGHRGVMVLLEQPECIARHAVHVAGALSSASRKVIECPLTTACLLGLPHRAPSGHTRRPRKGG